MSPDENVAIDHQVPSHQEQDVGDDVESSMKRAEDMVDTLHTTISSCSGSDQRTEDAVLTEEHGISNSFVKHEGESLSWTNVNMVLKSKKGKEQRHILRDVWGEANPGETTALLGPSGAGKTSLFNILAGRAPNKKKISIDAQVSVGGVPLNFTDLTTIRKKIAFVAQEDALHQTSTPREAIRFSAKLRLPRSTSNEAIDQIVDVYIKELGLDSCADTVIGGGLKKGISGGEKKRTSVGVELVVRPSIVLLDEPTSGLDSFSAEQVCKVLRKVAAAGTAVLFTIHQPSSDVFMAFDHFILMNRGRVMYQGVTEEVEAQFKSAGYPIPSNFNPADWILRIAQRNEDDELERKGFYPLDERKPTTAPSSGNIKFPVHVESATLRTELSLLFQRERRSMVRNKMPMVANVLVTALLSLIYGLFFLGVGRLDRADQTDMQAQVGATINILISTMMGQSQLSLTTFPTERPLFLREYATNHYGVFSYFVSKLGTEALFSFTAVMVQSLMVYFMIGFQQNFILFFAINWTLSMTSTAVAVFLGSTLSNPSQAPQFYTLVVVPQFYFSGVFTPLDLVPSFIRWLQYICSLRYAAGLSMIYEFGDCDPGLAEANCDNLLERNDIGTDDAWWFWLALCGLFLGFRLGALGFLRKRAAFSS